MVFALVLATFCGACQGDVSDSIPESLNATTWEFDDFYITFVSEDSLAVHEENPDEVLAEGRYVVEDGFIEIALDDRVRAGTWDGERLIVDGMVGRFVGLSVTTGLE